MYELCETLMDVKSKTRSGDFALGKTYAIVAVLCPGGEMRLYVDGALEAEGPGMSAAGAASFDVSRSRDEAFCGRWMRPDQSAPVRAGIVSVEVFDGALDAATVMRHYGDPADARPKYMNFL